MREPGFLGAAQLLRPEDAAAVHGMAGRRIGVVQYGQAQTSAPDTTTTTITLPQPPKRGNVLIGIETSRNTQSLSIPYNIPSGGGAFNWRNIAWNILPTNNQLTTTISCGNVYDDAPINTVTIPHLALATNASAVYVLEVTGITGEIVDLFKATALINVAIDMPPMNSRTKEVPGCLGLTVQVSSSSAGVVVNGGGILLTRTLLTPPARLFWSVGTWGVPGRQVLNTGDQHMVTAVLLQ